MSIFTIDKLAKSEDYVAEGADVSLEGHSWGVYKILSYLLEKVDLDDDKKKVMKIAGYLHDIGKKNKEFQQVLKGESKNYLKHEVKTLDYIDDIKSNWDKILAHLDLELDYSEEVLEDILAFAVSHHGLFFLSKVDEDEYKYKVKKYWTEFSPEEQSRITLTDLLFEYHPAGGFIVLADLIHSYSLAKGVDYRKKIKELSDNESILGFIEEYFADEALVAEKEKEARMTDALKEILKLTLGGVNL
ncbi:CRISPR-associated endonuclease Cas3-HD [Orenia metallireducens]|uniref:CRISPR-associated endonuclease Cas3-HD n=1 Tax=Orenia metallireducens TaxID=1413210 RepID=A0A285IAE6_9FIRM|nr:CRISPR-associated endonuclease Cas3'' [Orenia metallireducens]PRX21210.1 CRISPR-associated endonuclease Cas3-HD [Orenia metallireducens]SNY44883.1 CRISPR-associated endonuclease Cas3-HD [Orenia metallireducens]